MNDPEEQRELLAVAVAAPSELWGLGGEPAAPIARGALDEIELVAEAGECSPED